jgi:dihydroneopterin aldolase
MRSPLVHDPDGRPLDQIALTGLRVRGFHGVLASERRTGQDFLLDVVLHLDTRAAAAGDDLTATVDYGQVAVAVAGIVAGPPVQLIETLAERVALWCLEQPRVVVVDVVVHKPHAPVHGEFDDISVAVRRHRDGTGHR